VQNEIGNNSANNNWNNQLNTQYSQQELNDLMANNVVYPEIFYKLQPFVMMCCDQMDSYGNNMPNQEMLDQMTEGIYNDVCRMYPDIAEYANAYDKNASTDPEVINVINGFYGRGYRRRGLLRDVIGILLLSELFRRRRRFY
jgi:hypothetical protein